MLSSLQEGCRGLVKGAEKFDASKGFKFSTYAHWWIKQAVRKSLSEQSRTIRLPVCPLLLSFIYMHRSSKFVHFPSYGINSESIHSMFGPHYYKVNPE